MKLNILILSHGRLNELSELLKSIATANSYASEFQHLCEPVHIKIFVGINNDPNKLIHQKTKIISDLYSATSLDIAIVNPKGSTMSELRSSMWEMLKLDFDDSEFYMWMDDDDIFHVETFRILGLMYSPDYIYYQLNRCENNIKNYLKHSISTKDQTLQISSPETKNLSIATYEQNRTEYARLNCFNPTFSGGQVYMVKYSEDMYSTGIKVNAGEDTVPPLIYLRNIRNADRGFAALLNDAMILYKPSNTEYDLDSHIKALSEFPEILIKNCVPLNIVRTQMRNLIKHLTYHVYNHSRFNYKEFIKCTE